MFACLCMECEFTHCLKVYYPFHLSDPLQVIHILVFFFPPFQAAYMEWLCSTQLPLFHDGDCSISSESNVQGSDQECPARFKPCLSVCYKVLQNCPYYLPSKYQSDDELGKEFVFGGYPAFSCPGEKPAELPTPVNT